RLYVAVLPTAHGGERDVERLREPLLRQRCAVAPIADELCDVIGDAVRHLIKAAEQPRCHGEGLPRTPQPSHVVSPCCRGNAREQAAAGAHSGGSRIGNPALGVPEYRNTAAVGPCLLPGTGRAVWSEQGCRRWRTSSSRSSTPRSSSET